VKITSGDKVVFVVLAIVIAAALLGLTPEQILRQLTGNHVADGGNDGLDAAPAALVGVHPRPCVGALLG